MNSRRFTRHLAGYGAAAAIIAMGALTAACGGNGPSNPTSTTTTTTTTTSSSATAPPPASPTQKGVAPSGGNSFAPNPQLTPPSVYQNPHAHPG